MKTDTLKPHVKLARDPRYKRALVCGSPERAAKIAARLTNVENVAKNREYHSYLGQFKGKDVLVTSHGVGASGATICFQELIDVGVETIVRLGTAGGIKDDSKIGDIVVATGAVRKEGVSALMVPMPFPAIPDLDLTQKLISTFESKSVQIRKGIIISSDLFYPGLLDPELELYQKANAVAVEMECSALFVTGSLRNVRCGSVVVCDGNPLKWQQGDYDPTSTKLQDNIERCFDICLEALVAF
jgi:uridine phosphorylase